MPSVGKSDLAWDMSGKLDTLISAVIELKASQEGMKRTIMVTVTEMTLHSVRQYNKIL